MGDKANAKYDAIRGKSKQNPGSNNNNNRDQGGLKDSPDPRPPHDKKGKKKADEGNEDFQEPDKTMNVLFGGLPNRQSQKATRREVLNIEPAIPTPLRWSEVPITFSCVDQWTSFSEPVRFPLVLKPVVAGSILNKVLINGASGLNVLFTKTLKKM
jgi:hypothetical protein